MAKTGIRVNTERIRKKLTRLGSDTTANTFRPELLEYAKATLETCIDLTPVREEGLIEAAQQEQYANRVEYIESIHWGDADPRLIVKPNGAFLFSDGKWYRPDMGRRMPDSAYADYQALEAERQRRLSTPERRFIDDRKQSRFLYQRSWGQVALSIGIALANATAQIMQSHNRRKPSKEPPRGYAQIRGGETVISVVVRNEFLEQPSRYKNFTGKGILAIAKKIHRPRFVANVKNHMNRLLRAAARG